MTDTHRDQRAPAFGTDGDARDQAAARDVRAVVQAAVDAIGRAGTISAAGIADAVDSAGRVLCRRVVAGSVRQPRPVGDTQRLATALAERPRLPSLGNATAAAIVARIAARIGPLRFLTRRTPMWLVAAAVPALIASVSRGAEELGLVASNLAQRASDAGVVPDPDRVRRAAVQILLRDPVDPDVEPRHGSLALAWLRRSFRAALPFTAGVTTSDPAGLASAAGAVPPHGLGAPSMQAGSGH